MICINRTNFYLLIYCFGLVILWECVCNFFPYLRPSCRDNYREICDSWCIQSLAVLHNWARMHYRAALHPHGRFISWDPLYPGIWICGSPGKANSNWWTLGRKSSKICPSSYTWRDHGDTETSRCNKWSEQRILLGVPPILHNIFGGWEVQEILGSINLISSFSCLLCICLAGGLSLWGNKQHQDLPYNFFEFSLFLVFWYFPAIERFAINMFWL